MTINIVCVKDGDKYGPEYVNRLLSMCRFNISGPFVFYCYTDDPVGLDRSIVVLNIPEEENFGGYWNKLAVFQAGMYIQELPTLYLDLDTVIQRNIDSMIMFGKAKRRLIGVYTYWDEVRTDGEYPYATLRYKQPFNSSVMMFQAGQYDELWRKFLEDPDSIILKYYGDDRYIGNTVTYKDHWHKGTIYSRLYGMSETERCNTITKIEGGSQEVAYYPNAKICMLNGPTTPYHYEDLRGYWERT